MDLATVRDLAAATPATRNRVVDLLRAAAILVVVLGHWLIAAVTVRYGEPIDLSHLGPASSGKARRLATDEIMAAIHALSGQELANAYNEAPAANPVERLKQVLPHERR